MKAIERRLTVVERLHFVLLVLAAPLLLFPTVLPRAAIAAALLLVITWLAGGRDGMARSVPAPMRLPLAVLALGVVVGAWVSPAWDVSFPKLFGVVLGMAVMAATIRLAADRRSLWRAAALYALAGTGLVILGSLGAMWVWSSKVPLIDSLSARLPRLFEGLPGAAPGVNPNALGGTTLLVLPLLLCAVFMMNRRREAGLMHARWVRIGLWGMLVVNAAVLLLSQSRASWIAVLLAMTIVAALARRVWTSRRLAWSIAAVVSVAALIAVYGWQTSERYAEQSQTGIGRRALWDKALRDIAAAPLTGIGLNYFRRTVYVPPRPPGPPADVDIAHAHNTFLQVALDTGVPGLLAYVALVAIALGMCVRACRRSRPLESALALGLLGNLLAIHIFGMADAIALGAKVGLLFWWTLGLAAAVYRLPADGGP